MPLDAIKNALIKILDRSEFNYANWAEYDAKGEELTKQINDLLDTINSAWSSRYGAPTILSIFSQLIEKMKEWAIYKNDSHFLTE